jgi:hypothetical protein
MPDTITPMADQRGRVSALDDFAVHQTPELVADVATTDPNFFERFYFNLFSHSDDLFMIVGLGQYPNRGLMDAFAIAVRHGVQHSLRSSVVFDGDRLHTRAGPLAIEILSGTRTVNVRADAHEGSPIEFDLTWQADIAPYLEQRTHAKTGPRVTDDGQRFVQTGRWNGTLALGDEQFAITSDRFWGARDRSWGLRRLADSVPLVPAPRTSFTSFFTWTPMQFEDYAVLYASFEDAAGIPERRSAHLVGNLPDTEVVDLGPTDHQLAFVPGSRRLAGGTISFQAAHPDIEIEALTRLCLDKGSGYGQSESWQHGSYRGPSVVEFSSTPQEELFPTSWIDACLCRFRRGGDVGYGVFDTTIVGDHVKYPLDPESSGVVRADPS